MRMVLALVLAACLGRASAEVPQAVPSWECTHTLVGHKACVRMVAMSPDGKQFASASDDFTARIWDWEGKTVRILSGHTESINHLCWSADGTRIATAAGDPLKPRLPATPCELLPERTMWGVKALGSLAVSDAAFSPDGTRLATAGTREASHVWDARTGDLLQTLPHPDPKDEAKAGASCVAYSPDGRRVAIGFRGGRIGVWDAGTGESVLAFQAHKQDVRCVAFTPDLRHLLSSGYDGLVALWKADTGEAVRTFKPTVEREGTPPIRMNDHEAPLVMVHKWWEVWDLETAKPLVRLKGQELWTQGGAAVSPDGRRVVGGSAVAFSPDGRTIAAAVNDGAIWLWDAATGERTGVLEGAPGGTFRLGFSRDGSRILSYGPKALLAWDVATRACLAILRNPPGGLWSPNADEVFLLNGAILSLKPRKVPDPGHGNDVRVWDPQTGTCLLTIPDAHDQMVYGVEISPDGKRLLTLGGGGTAKLWDAGTGRRVAELILEEGVQSATFSPDGFRILTGSPRGVVLWDAVTRTPIHRFDMEEAAHARFTPDGKRILGIAGHPGHALLLWDATTFERLKTIAMPADVDQICSATFSPDSQWILTTHGLTARIWGIESGKEAVNPMSPDSGMVHAVYSPDGRRIVIAAYNSHRVYVLARKDPGAETDRKRGPSGSR